MVKALSRLRKHILISTVIQLVIVIILTTLYFINVFDLQRLLTVEVALIITLIAIVFNVLYGWIHVAVVMRARMKENVSSLTLLGGDVREVYDFGAIGLVLVDKDFNIVWANELFKERRLYIVDKNILTWQPELTRLVELSESLYEEESLLKLEIESRNYEVKYLAKAGLFLFRDNTEFEYLFEKSQANAPVLGLITIDNYNEIIDRDEMINPVISAVVNEVFDYCRNFGALVKQYRDDSFIVIMNKQTLDEMYEDKFSLLDTVRNKTEMLDFKTTLSMAVAHNFPDVMKLNDLVVNALDTALARGGDQIVIATHGEETEYIGGAGSQSERRNRTSIRLYADTIFRHIRDAKNVLIMSHTQTDLDALGSSLGMKELADYIKHKQKDNEKFPTAKILYDPAKTETKTRAALEQSFSQDEFEEYFISNDKLDEEKGAESLINSQTLLIIVDVSRPSITLNPALIERVDNIIVIDHHRRTGEFIDTRIYDYIETAASSTSEIITEIMYYGNTTDFKLSEKTATLMLAGIYLDTNYFRSNTTGSRTFFASMILEDWGADVLIADDFLKDEFEEYTLITKILASLETLQPGIVILKAGEKDIVTPETLAKAANTTMRIKGINAVFVVGYTSPDVVKLSARSDGTVNVQLISEKLGGGGNQASAAATMEKRTLEQAYETIVETIEHFIHLARTT